LKRSLVLLFLVIIAVVTVEKLIALPTYGKPTATVLNPDYGGLMDFYRFLISEGYDVVVHNKYSRIHERHLRLLIAIDALPSDDYVRDVLNDVKKGNVLIVADELTYVNKLLEPLGVGIHGKVIRYLDRPNSHIIKAKCLIRGHALELILNKASIVKVKDYEKLEGSCRALGTVFVDLNGNGFKDSFEPTFNDALVGVLVPYGNGSVFILADSSPFVNLMLRSNYSDIEYSFIKNVIKSIYGDIGKIVIDESFTGTKLTGLRIIPSIVIGLMSSFIYTLRLYMIESGTYVTLITLLFAAVLTTLFICWHYGSRFTQDVRELIKRVGRRRGVEIKVSKELVRYSVEEIHYLFSKGDLSRLVSLLSKVDVKPKEVYEVLIKMLGK